MWLTSSVRCRAGSAHAMQAADMETRPACDVTVVICTHNRMSLLRQALDALRVAPPPDDLTVDLLIVANACNESTLRELHDIEAQWAPHSLGLRVLEEPVAGKSHALNSALATPLARHVCFIDDDQVVAPDYFHALSALIRRNLDYGMYCGWMLPAWDGSEPSWVHRRDEYRIPVRPFPEYDFGETETEITGEMKIPSGGNIIIRRDVIERTGRFSAELGPTGHNLMGGEDIDYIRRALQDGCRLLYVPGLRQRHLLEPERMTTRYMMRKCFLRSYSSILIHGGAEGIRMVPSLLRKGVTYTLHAAFSTNRDRRFYWLMRLAATAGEMRAQFG
ncbi:glycosyltransferase family 2 protein [Methyloversatilis sp.]|uniref:glycosyltransferase family 2 protein n=1 Tax=Methyloversatilis sp. TaxID=2569862 RepID=UPI0035240176